MPRISVVFYQEDAQTVPVLDWLDGLPAKLKINAAFVSSDCGIWGMNCAVRRDGIYEFRGGLQRAVEKDPPASLHSIDSLQRTA